ncbi:DUF1194 domain-containing protein [Aliiroseovarius sp. KMU-50]|uniref:DUF1194 domain-containing protein n=1 Tax=Aliiroseovarius salicola TaxID=3009082 RepID=A0ABT4W179_9RHOB|nr:DUF1194 domain-containing protein [Aliiroseovarius sp. KMU-50]MDA5094258.1 DUF1194 domain-containing protein [Aliiroseovarius sp. KMU-50]
MLISLCVLSGVSNAAACRQALALGIDVSGSVDDREYRLQLDGIASALRRKDITSVLLSNPEAPVALAIYEWSGPNNQRVLIPWHNIQSLADIDAIASKLVHQTRRPGDPSTAIGKSLLFGAELLMQRPDCWQHTLDLSGDGMSNSGPRPSEVEDAPLLGQILVNGLVISPDGADDHEGLEQLTTYFQELVIRGPFSFVEQAAGYEDYTNAIARKLLRELSGIVVSYRPRTKQLINPIVTRQ